jgi:hypothetical protein
VAISTGSLQTVFSNAGVGIGTNAPISAAGYNSLTVASGGNGGRVDLVKSGTRFASMYSSGTDLFDIEAVGTTTTIRLNTNGAERVRIDPNGNVGIGTSSPAVDLDVVKTKSAGATVIRAYNIDPGSTSSAQLQITQGSVITSVTSYGNTIGYIGTSSNNPVGFITNNTEHMRLDASGSLGIGTTTPAAKLDVNGTVNISGNTAIGGNATIAGNVTVTGNASFIGTTTLGSNANVRITGGSNGQVLSTNGSGVLSWITPTGGGGNSTYNGLKNRVVNGSFDIWQRGTSFLGKSVAPSDVYYTADRWMIITGAGNPFGTSSGDQNITVSLSNDVPQGLFINSAKVGRPSGQVKPTPSWNFIAQNIEYRNFADLVGQTITLSFWVKAGANFSGLGIDAEMRTGSTLNEGGLAGAYGGWTGSSAFYIFSPITTTWARYVYTTTLPANAKSLVLVFGYYGVGTAGAEDNFYITGIQLEAGPTVTSYDIRSITEVTAQCQRFFCKNSSIDVVPTNGLAYTSPGAFSSGTIGAYAANAGYINWISFPVQMFKTPAPANVKFINSGSLASTTTANQWCVYNGSIWGSSTQIGPQSITDSGMGLQVSGTFPAGTSLWYGAWNVSADL